MELPEFRYMRWAKTYSGDYRYDLTASSAPALPLPPCTDPQEYRQHPTGDGDPVIEALVAEHLGVPTNEALYVPGSTLGNFLLAKLHVEPGARVLVESPVYENLPGLVRLLGATILPLPRDPAEGYRVDPDRVERAFADGVRLAMLTDLHNPTGARLSDEELAAIRSSAARHGASIIVDEVYRDFLPGHAGTAYRAGDDTVLAVSSLTKVYGLGPIRAGWILAPAEVRARAARLLDYLTVIPPTPAAQAAEAALRSIDERREAARAAAAAGRAVFEDWLAGTEGVDWCPPAAGVVCFPRIEGVEDTGPLCEWLRDERDTALVPGHFFGDASRVRLAFGVDPTMLAAALERVSEGLARFR